MSGRRVQSDVGHQHGGPNTLGAGGDRAATFGFGRVARVDRNQGRFYRGLRQNNLDETRDLGFRRTERDVAIDAPVGAGASDRLLARSQVVIPAEDNDGDLAVGANDAGRAQPHPGNPDDLQAGAARLGAEQADLNREVADVDLS